MSSKHGLAPFDPAAYLTSEEAIAEYLRALWEDGGVPAFISGLGDAVRAKGMMQMAKEAGVGQESLCRSLAGGDASANPTIAKVAKMFGVNLGAPAAAAA